MRRKIPKTTIFVLALVSLLFGGIVRFAFNANAASSVTFTFAISPAGTGSVTGYDIRCPASSGLSCSHAFDYSSTAAHVYTATPKSGYHFVGWENNPSIRSGTDYTANPLTVHLSKSWNFTAKFEKDTTPAPTPTPTPAPDPAPVDPGGDVSGGGGSSSSDISSDTGGGGDTIVLDNPIDSSTGTVDQSDKEAPSVPANLLGGFDKDSNTITLNWDNSTDNVAVSGYEVQRSEKGSGNWESVGNVASNSFTDFQFAPNSTIDYQVRAYDDGQNYSAWSPSVEVVAGDFKPNVTVKDGGSVTGSDGVVTLEAPANAVNADLVFMINPVKVKGLTLPGNTKLVGTYYDIKAKDAQGNEVTKFGRQIMLKFDYRKANTFGANKSSIKIATSDGKKVQILRTSLDTTNATTLTDHLTLYFMTAEKNGFWGTFAWIVLWLLVIGGIIAGGYYGWQRYNLYNYQQEHKEDFIYKH